jgi:hypothetical protein
VPKVPQRRASVGTFKTGVAIPQPKTGALKIS